MSQLEVKSVKNIALNYSAIVISVLATLYIYPLDFELYGYIQKLTASGTLLSAFLSFGSYSLITKYFPYFENKKQSGFFFLVLLFSLSTSFVFTLIYFSIYHLNIHFSFIDLNYTFNELVYIYSLGLIFSFFALFRSHAFNLKKVNIPDFLTSISIKLFLPILVLCSFIYSVQKEDSVSILLIYYTLIVFIFLIYLLKIDSGLFTSNSLKFVRQDKIKEMLKYMFFSGFNHAGNILAYKMDLIIIGYFLTDTSTGHYSTFLFLAVLIEIPTKTILQISSPLISNYYESNQLEKINTLYKKSSINLFTVGVLVYVLICINIDVVFTIMKNGSDIQPFKFLIFLLGFAKLIDMTTSINTSIIAYSKYYKYNTLFLFILSVSNIVLSSILVNYYGLYGVAASTLFSVFLYNFIKSIFIYKTLNLQPFKKEHFYPFIILLLGFILVFIDSSSFNFWVLIVIKNLIYIVCFYFLIIHQRIVPDINVLLSKFIPLKYFKNGN